MDLQGTKEMYSSEWVGLALRHNTNSTLLENRANRLYLLCR